MNCSNAAGAAPIDAPAPAKQSYAALIRDAAGEVVGSTWGGTACLAPRRPSKLAAVSDDREHVIRCGECDGCRELDRRRLAERLQHHYADKELDLWQLEVNCPLDQQSQLAANLRRGRMSSLVTGFYRISSARVAFIVEKVRPRLRAMRSLRPWTWRLTKLSPTRGKRRFAPATAGIALPRSEWGEWTNRFYHRGLKPLPSEIDWTIEKREGMRYRHQLGGNKATARAWKDGLTIHLPERVFFVNLLSRPRRRRARNSQPMAAATGVDTRYQSPAKPAALETSRFRNATALHVAGRDSLRGRDVPCASPPKDTAPLILKGAGYRGSLHSVSAQSAPARPRTRAAPFDFAEWGERMRALAEKRPQREEDE